MADQLHYPGNCTWFDPNHLMGPDCFGAYYRTVGADYEAELDRTTLQLVPIPPAELQQHVQDHLAEVQRRAIESARVAALFSSADGGASR